MNAAFRITDNTLVTVVNKSAYVFAIVISCANPGTSALKLHIQNGETPAKILIPAYTLEAEPVVAGHPPNPREFNWVDAPKLMKNGIKIQANGTASDADVSVWISYETTEVSA
jgi:hypothetical protein